MFSSWKCIHCELWNFDTKDHCQACFNATTNPSPFQLIERRQNFSFYGYLRIHILNNNLDKQPMDVVKLCLKFYEINIRIDFDLNDEYHLDIREFAQTCLVNGESFMCHQIAQMLINSNPKESSFYFVSAAALTQWNQFEKADIEFQKAIELDDNRDPNYRATYGISLTRNGKYKEAIIQYLKVTHSLPNDADLRLNIADCYKQINDYENAHKYYLEAIEIGGDKTGFYSSCYAAFLCEDAGDFEESEKYYEEAIEMEPDNADYYYDYAKYLRDYAKDYKESEKNYLKALELHNTESAHGSYGYLLYLMGDYEKAMRQIELELYESCGTNEYGHLYHGLVSMAIGDVESAQESVVQIKNRLKTKSEMLEMAKFLNVMMHSVDDLHLQYIAGLKEMVSDLQSKE